MKAVLSRARYVAVISVSVVLVVAVLAALGGCGGSASTTTTAAYSTTGDYETTDWGMVSTTAAPATTMTTTGATETTQNRSGSSVSSAQPNVSMLTGEHGQKIIGDAVLEIEVEQGGFQMAFNNAALLSDRYGGYIVSSQSSASGRDGKIDGGTMAIRVPAASFSAAIADAGKLGTLKNQEIKTQDVTEEFVDLQARITNSQAKLDTFRKLFDKATNIDDIVNVQQFLTAAQDELEQLKGRQRFLQEHTSYSTLTMNIREKGAEPVTTTTTAGSPWGVGKAFGDAAHNFVKAVNSIIRALGVLIPVLVVLAIIAYVVYRVWRWNRRRHGRLDDRPFAAVAVPQPVAVPAKPAGEADKGAKPADPAGPKTEG